jgi:signal transduction histidine kinase
MATLLRFLVEPSPSVPESGRRHARLLASALAILIPLIPLALLVQSQVEKDFLPSEIAAIPILVCEIVCYGLSRTRYHRAGAILLAITLTLGSTLAAFVDPHDHVAAFFAIDGPIAALIFLEPSWVAAMVALAIAGNACLAFSPGNRPMEDVTAAVIFQLLSGVIVLTAMTHRRMVRREREEMEAKLVLAERMASLGVLAASIAHEINTPLTYVVTALQLMDADLESAGGDLSRLDSTRVKRRLDAVREGAARVRTIVRDLGRFSRPDDDRMVPVDLPSVVDSTLRVAKPQLHLRVVLRTDLRATGRVIASESRLAQVLLNLLVNAYQAMPEGRESGRNRIEVRTYDSGGEVTIEVSDNGEGIAPDLLDRIFDPFFTTRAAAGSGLGLAISRSLVAGMGGTMSVESRPGEGTTFRVRLRAVTAATLAA